MRYFGNGDEVELLSSTDLDVDLWSEEVQYNLMIRPFFQCVQIVSVRKNYDQSHWQHCISQPIQPLMFWLDTGCL